MLRATRLFAGPAALVLTLGVAGFALTSAEPGEAQITSSAPEWTIQPGGRLGFAVGNAGETVTGTFGTWGGQVFFDPEDPSTAAIRIEVDLASASMKDQFQDKLLKQEDEFFGFDPNAKAVWESNAVEALGDGKYRADGTLSLRGVSMDQPLEFTLSGDGPTRHVEGSAEVDRFAYNIGTGSNGASLDQEVTVSFAFDATGGRP